MAPLRWGLLGTARINRSIIPALRAASRSVLAGVASRTAERASAYAAEWEIPGSYAGYDAMLADPNIDVVYIPLPNHLHVEWTLRAIAAGKHVLCEKPLALTAADVDRVAAAATRRGVVVAEAFMYRHHPLTARAVSLVRDGALGPLKAIRGTFTFVLTRPGDVRLVPEWGGGSLWDVGCYPVSYARVLTGEEPVSVTAQAVGHESGIDMAMGATLLFPRGVLAVIDCGFGAHFRTSVEVAGADAVMTIDTPFKPGAEAELRLTRGDLRETIAVAGEPLYLGEVEDLEAAVLDGHPPRVSLADTRGNVAALVAIHQAARTGRVVSVADHA
jgi:xylose dehydrogenase (NAD/NADP)